MSTLLEQASLVMIPSGYKEDVVYSQIPTNGNGDLSFTRASNGTRVNSAGLVEVCPWNYKSYSEDLTNGVGLQASTITTITANTTDTTDPFGTNKAEKFDGNSGERADTYNPIPENSVITYSIYAKAGSVSTFILRLSASFGTTAQATFNLSSGTITATSGDVYLNSTITPLGNGWYRCSITYNFISVPTNRILLNANGSLYFFGWQLNIGATAKPYFPTTDRLNVPRLTYQNGGGGCPSLLLEKQSTNLVTYSEDLTNAVWLTAGGITVTANATTSPDGTQNADLFSHGSFSTYLYENLGTLSGTITTSIFVKKGSQSSIAFGFVSGGFGGGMSVKFNLDTQTFSGLTNYANFTSITATYESYGNGWYRLNLTGTTATSAVYYYVLGSLLDSFAVNAYLWGAQVEASSYPTSYIPTTSSSATRVVDGGYKFNISSLIGQSEGTIFLNYTLLNNSTDDITIGITGNNGKIIWFRKNGIQFYGNGTTLLFDASSTGTMGVTYKMAFVYGQSDFRLYINGSLIGSVTSGTFTGTFDDFTFFPVGGVPYTNANKINEMVFFKTKLTNAELAQLTA